MEVSHVLCVVLRVSCLLNYFLNIIVIYFSQRRHLSLRRRSYQTSRMALTSGQNMAGVGHSKCLLQVICVCDDDNMQVLRSQFHCLCISRTCLCVRARRDSVSYSCSILLMRDINSEWLICQSKLVNNYILYSGTT